MRCSCVRSVTCSVRVVKLKRTDALTPMEYVNSHGVRFRINTDYTARYYTKKDKWPRVYRRFVCLTDENRREMFYMLNNARLCSTCESSLLDYRVDSEQTVCKTCVLRQNASPSDDDIAECPICYQKMLSVDCTRKTLPCRHDVCTYCVRRMIRVIRYVGPTCEPIGIMSCPLCRHEAYYSKTTLFQVDGGIINRNS